MIRWGVIGAGGFADKRAIPGMLEAGNCRLQAVMVRDVARAEALARKHGAQASYADVDSLLADPEVDAVYVCTPVHLHREHTVKAAQAGKHVLCEKPLALTAEQGEDMARACAAHDRILMPGFMFRFHTSHIRVKEMIDSGALGQVVSARAQLCFWYPETPDAWRQVRQMGGGGCLMDVGSHCLDLLCYLLGDVTSVAAMQDTAVFDYEVEDIIHVLVKFASRAQGIVDVGFCVPHRENYLEVYGTKGSLLAQKTIGPFADPTVKWISEDGEQDVAEPFRNTYAAEFEHFADCVERGERPRVGAEEGITNLRLIEAAYRSAESGRVIAI
ncbi:MAG: Gfo/Idh/MocA family oxidoreductase [Candidatus Latescibacteria bacterium]|jgi:predicted dehydrogenase|nr:Gfo/Idh/MocA family oxidoreductase [Candidatus Latescibacterota bacterium]